MGMRVFSLKLPVTSERGKVRNRKNSFDSPGYKSDARTDRRVLVAVVGALVAATIDR